MNITKEQTEDLAREACWEAGDWPCDGNCHKCDERHWKHYKTLVKAIVKRWETIKMREKECEKCVYLKYLEAVQDMSQGFYCTRNPKCWELIIPSECDNCKDKRSASKGR